MKLVKKLILPFLIAILMFLLGGFLAFRQMKTSNLASNQALKKGSWRLPPKMDLSENMWTRAKVALTGVFALRESEVFYAVANQDKEGKALEGKSTYKVSGKNFDARYWSITLYGEDYFLVPNEGNSFNVNMYDVNYDKKGNFSFIISPKKQSGTWLPSDKKQKFDLLLRLYNPSEKIINNLENLELPVIEKIKN